MSKLTIPSDVLYEKVRTNQISEVGLLEAYEALEHELAQAMLNASLVAIDRDGYAVIHAAIREQLEPHFPPSTILSCLRDLLADKRRMDTLEKDGVLTKLFHMSVSLKDFNQATWNMRGALDSIGEGDPTEAL